MNKNKKSQPAGRQGFTLIELLIVIAILGVLSAVVLVGIDPVDKINAANDSNVQNSIGAIANATEAYAVGNNGVYPTSADIGALQTTLTTSGDLKVALTVPTGYTLSGSSAATLAKACVTLKSKKYTATPFWTWSSDAGKAYAAAACL